MNNKHSRPNNASLSSSKFRPRFKNPHSIPPVDDFRLDHILAHPLINETASVTASLVRVSSNYQQDLKSEIRKALAIEQKIQNKNINAIKRAHKLSKQWHSRRKLLGHGSKQGGHSKRGKSEKKGLGTDINKLLTQATDVSSNVRDLVSRVSELSVKRGGNGLPDPQKYPKLSKLFESMQSVETFGEENDGTSAGNDVNGTTINSENAEESLSRILIPLLETDCSKSQEISAKSVEALDPQGESSLLMRQQEQDLKTQQSKESEESSPTQNEPIMDSDAFELFMDTSIARYRERVDEKYRSLDSSNSKSTQSETKMKSPRNPLRLLSSGSIGLNGGQFIKSSPFYEESDPFKYSFLPRKSTATVLETPELSLHKKLRIKVQPSSSKSQTISKCECQSSTQETSAKSSEITNGHQNMLQKSISDEVWSSSEAHTETEIDSDNILGSSSSSDEGNSSDSLNEHISGTNSYYSMLSANLRSKSRQKKRQRLRARKIQPSEVKEFSPSPKHEPSHRVLQPKQSILKLSKGKNEKSLFFDVSPNPNDTESPQGEAPKSLVYTASPRASFINEEAISGTFMKQVFAKNRDDDHTLNKLVLSDFEPSYDNDDISETHPDAPKKEESQVVGRLKSLIFQNGSPTDAPQNNQT